MQWKPVLVFLTDAHQARVAFAHTQNQDEHVWGLSRSATVTQFNASSFSLQTTVTL